MVIFIFYVENGKLLNRDKLKHIFKIKSLIVTSDDRKCRPSVPLSVSQAPEICQALLWHDLAQFCDLLF
jgi:hypothetical protein